MKIKLYTLFLYSVFISKAYFFTSDKTFHSLNQFKNLPSPKIILPKHKSIFYSSIFCKKIRRVAPAVGKYTVGASAVRNRVHAVCPNPGRTSRTQLTTPEEKVRAEPTRTKPRIGPRISLLTNNKSLQAQWWRVVVLLRNTHTILNVIGTYMANKRSINAFAFTVYMYGIVNSAIGWGTVNADGK